MKSFTAIILGLALCFTVGCNDTEPCEDEVCPVSCCVEECKCAENGICCCDPFNCKEICDCEDCDCKA